MQEEMRETRNPHNMRRLLAEAMSRHGHAVTVEQAGSHLASLMFQPGWDRLLDVWATEAVVSDDRHLASGAVLARRSRQLDYLRGLGLRLSDAIDVVYSIRPTSTSSMTEVDPGLLAKDGHAVRDGFFVRLRPRESRWRVEEGFGHLGADGGLVVQCLTGAADLGSGPEVAAAVAARMLEERAEEVRQRFLECRSYFRFSVGSLFETVSGSMDGFEVISPDIGRAYLSGSDETGCYVLSRSAAASLPAFAAGETTVDGRCYLDADGMGLIVPMIFPALFTERERDRAGKALERDHPLTFAVLSGGLLGKANFNAVMMEWDDEHEDEDLPEFMIVRPLDALKDGREVVVLGVRTDDVLARREFAEGHVFAMSVGDFVAERPIDPALHRKIQSPTMSVTLVWPRQ